MSSLFAVSFPPLEWRRLVVLADTEEPDFFSFLHYRCSLLVQRLGRREQRRAPRGRYLASGYPSVGAPFGLHLRFSLLLAF